MVLYNVVAGIIGGLRDRDKAMQRRYTRLGGWQRLKRVSLFGHDLKTPLIAIGGMSVWFIRISKKITPPKKAGHYRRGSSTIGRNDKGNAGFFQTPGTNRSQEDIESDQAVSCDHLRFAQERKVKVGGSSRRIFLRFLLTPQRMKQALINLLMTPLKPRPRGNDNCAKLSKMEKAHCRCERPGAVYRLIRKKTFFSPFFTTKEPWDRVGPSYYEKIVEAHDGSWKYSKTVKKGAIFRIMLHTV